MGARKKKGSQAWTNPFLMADTKGIPDCNPVLFLNKKGKLFIFWIAVMANKWENSIIRYRTTTDFGGEMGRLSGNGRTIFFSNPVKVLRMKWKKRFAEMPKK